MTSVFFEIDSTPWPAPEDLTTLSLRMKRSLGYRVILANERRSFMVSMVFEGSNKNLMRFVIVNAHFLRGEKVSMLASFTVDDPHRIDLAPFLEVPFDVFRATPYDSALDNLTGPVPSFRRTRRGLLYRDRAIVLAIPKLPHVNSFEVDAPDFSVLCGRDVDSVKGDAPMEHVDVIVLIPKMGTSPTSTVEIRVTPDSSTTRPLVFTTTLIGARDSKFEKVVAEQTSRVAEYMERVMRVLGRDPDGPKKRQRHDVAPPPRKRSRLSKQDALFKLRALARTPKSLSTITVVHSTFPMLGRLFAETIGELAPGFAAALLSNGDARRLLITEIEAHCSDETFVDRVINSLPDQVQNAIMRILIKGPDVHRAISAGEQTASALLCVLRDVIDKIKQVDFVAILENVLNSMEE